MFRIASQRQAQMFAPALRRAAQNQFRPAQTAFISTASKMPEATPTYIKGDVNDATTFPPPSRTHGSYHWTFERLLSASLIPMVGATFVSSAHPVLDGLLSVALVFHSHIGFDSCVVDYLHERKFPVIGPIAKWAVRILTGGVLVGVYQFNTNDIGLTEFIKRIWQA
ncbi:hypothetical protein BT69DRAFT_1266500 [Atractiella rhizophila]|nr:hypothetical protein BT69DRAFT_1266500 [Atractiella rhizophila]